MNQVKPPASTAQLLDACVHCGFCLATCPSYRVIGKENDSPRGRIYLMGALQAQTVDLSPAAVAHFDSCLGCLACVSACPSGVKYDQLIATTRPAIEAAQVRSLPQQLLRALIFGLFPYPQRLRRLRALLQLYQGLGLAGLAQRWLPRLSPPLGAMAAILPPLAGAAWEDDFPVLVPAQGQRRYRVGLLLGCVQRLFNPEVNHATIRVLAANGCDVVIPPTQGCCGALPHHQGQEEQAQALARQLIDSFRDAQVDAILVNASGCGHTLKEYGQVLAADPVYGQAAREFAARIRDVQEFLATVGLTAPLAPLQTEPLVVVYQDACHLLHGQKISHQPRQLLRQIPGVQLREPRDAALCCGSAGVYNILQPETAQELGRQKVGHLLDTGAQVIASANIGCFTQISYHLRQAGRSVPVLHPMQLLDLSLRGVRLDAF